MGKPTGFLEYEREDAPAYSPKERMNFTNHYHLKNKDARLQDVWIAEFHFVSQVKC